ncbi:alpha/beta hydrolase [uncultured Tateyamaria sp.]|uniref:alpha/beta fold hydrolase n=1 Tax=uncultured Tateyamaria sp. TaxID=455651 RepID=UPI00260E50B3|nr:alpha/beta hydrolase [uncultured Tateyamaria sp.]
MTWTTRQRSDLGPLAAVVAGQGPDIVLLHGVGLRAEAWNAQIDALAGHCRVSAIDLPGHGRSVRLTAPSGVADYTDAVASCLAGPALIVGHSFGAMIALDMAARHPRRVLAVVALNAIKGRSPTAAQAVQSRAANLDGTTNPDPGPTLHRWFGATVSPERTACEAWLTQTDPAGYKSAYTVFANADGPTDADLRALGCPALFATGADEPNSTPAMSHHMAELAPHGRALIVAGAAHMMPVTHPGIVNDSLHRFASEVFG